MQKFLDCFIADAPTEFSAYFRGFYLPIIVAIAVAWMMGISIMWTMVGASIALAFFWSYMANN